MAPKLFIVLSVLAVSCLGQRSPYAGRRPIGYPAISTTTTTTEAGDLGNRFGDSAPSTTTMRLPVEALGDRDLVDRLSKLPIDQQPFWFINWQALEAQRKNPQTYPQRPNGFVDMFAQIRPEWQ
ncbi:uncharacterized protein LOC126373899 [Pectinophora gossypiella]|uniref:uncharacterized protein LOC126373899 n=1 Tax=Pectinophora gossypiella TaxID=13191 RepID=UPI00214E7EF1|nr:uncharacterized protein LOC126373899 [Pectinophora gossypiella]